MRSAGNIPAGNYAIADWLVSNGTAWVQLPIGASAAASVIAPNVNMSPVVNTWADVQAAVEGLYNDKVELTGDTMVGPLVLSGDPTLPLHPVSLQYLEAFPVDAGTY